MMAAIMTLLKYPRSSELSLSASKCVRSRDEIFFLAACSDKTSSASGQKFYSQSCIIHVAQPYLVNNIKKMAWSIQSSVDGSGLNTYSTDSPNGRTRLIRVIQDFQTKLGARIQEIRKGLPLKLLFFLVGFYCATAFATVIGQTGDWDILSAALAVVVVEAIGALMYRASLPLVSKSGIECAQGIGQADGPAWSIRTQEAKHSQAEPVRVRTIAYDSTNDDLIQNGVPEERYLLIRNCFAVREYGRVLSS